MKKLVLALVLTTAVAFGTKAQVYVQGGLNLANITKTNDGQTEKNNILPTFNVGILGRVKLASMFSLDALSNSGSPSLLRAVIFFVRSSPRCQAADGPR